MRAYENIKELVKKGSNEQLKEMYLEIMNRITETETEELVVLTAITTELENRGVIEFNEDTFEYEFIA